MTTSTITASSSASVLPTIGGVNITDALRLSIGDTDAQNYEFSNTDLLTLFPDALTKYQAYRPYTLTQTITLVANQKDYALPTACVKVLSHNYRVFPGIGSETFIAYYNIQSTYPWFVPYYEWTDAVINLMRQELYRRYDVLGAGQAEVIDYQTSYAATKYLRIFPTPTQSGETFEVKFYADHPSQGNDYFTIPSNHAVYVRKLLQIEALNVRLSKMSASASKLAVGTTRTEFVDSMKVLSAKIDALEQEVHLALTSPQARTG